MFEYKDLKKNSTAHKIYLSAKKLFFQNGIENTSVRSLALDAGVNLGSITYHFKEKKDITTRIYAQVCNEMENFFPVSGNGLLSLHDYFFFEMLHLKALIVSPAFHELCRCSIDQDEINRQYYEWNVQYIRQYAYHDASDSDFIKVIPYMQKGLMRELSDVYHRFSEEERPSTRSLLNYYMDALIQSIFPPEVRDGYQALDEYRNHLLDEFDYWYVDIVKSYTPVFIQLDTK